jgi:hypothetical protein
MEQMDLESMFLLPQLILMRAARPLLGPSMKSGLWQQLHGCPVRMPLFLVAQEAELQALTCQAARVPIC